MKSGSITKAALISYAVIIFNIIAGLLYTPWMIKVIGKDDFGLYVLVTSFLSYFVIDYGMFQSINKLISEYRAEGNIDKIKKTIGVASKIYLIWDIIIVFILFLVYNHIETLFSNLSENQINSFKDVFIIASVFSILNFPFGFIKGVMFAYEHIVENRLFELVFKVLLILSTILILILDGGLYWLVVVYGCIPFLKNLALTYFLYLRGIRMEIKHWSSNIARSILGLSAWLFLYVISELFVNNISVSIIALKHSLNQVAVFAIGFTIYGYAYQISNSISGIFISKISKLNYEGRTNDIIEYAIKVGRYQLIITGFISFGIFTTGSYFINAWMGEGFHDSYYVAFLMVIPGLISFTQQVQQAQLYAKNKIHLHSIMMLFTAISSFSLSIYLVPKFGAIGASMAISISSLIFMGVGMTVVYIKILGFEGRNTILFFLKFITVFIIISLICFTLTNLILNFYSLIDYKYLAFIISLGLYSILFCLGTYFSLLNSDEKSVILIYINKLINNVKK